MAAILPAGAPRGLPSSGPPSFFFRLYIDHFSVQDLATAGLDKKLAIDYYKYQQNNAGVVEAGLVPAFQRWSCGGPTPQRDTSRMTASQQGVPV